MKTKDSLSDPEAIALSKVYALLIRVARQRKGAQAKANETAEIKNVQENTTEILQSGNLATIPLSFTE